MSPVQLTLWSGTLGQHDFERRLACAARAGYESMSVFPWDCRAPGDAKSRALELRKRADDRGVALTCLDPFTSWLALTDVPPNDPVPEQSVYARLFASYEPAEIFTMAAELGASTISAVALADQTAGLAAVAEGFAAACHQAAAYGLALQLEFMPFSLVADLESAYDVVSAAGAANAGLVLDVWHFMRSGSSVEQLAAIPGDRLFTVQLNDGPSAPEPDLWQAAAHDRLLPGRGQFDVVPLLRSLPRGARLDVGPEVLSDSLCVLDPLEVAMRAATASRQVLQEAGF